MDYYRINELPETAKRYKTYTKDFEKWLLKTAKKRGLEIAAQAEAAAKEASAKQKKKNGRSKEYHILTKDLVPLAEALVNSGIPVEDKSGLADLNDALRLRKEVNEWYRQKKISDEQHPFFNSILSDVRSLFKDWVFDSSKNTDRKKNQNHSFVAIVVDLSNDLGRPTDSEDGTDATANEPPDSTLQQAGSHSKKRQMPLIEAAAAPRLTGAELETEQDFEVLCFLYDLYQIRQRVEHIWKDWRSQKIGTMTAALASDIAMGRVHQRATILAEDLKDAGSHRTISEIVEDLCKLIPDGTEGVPSSSEESDSLVDPRDLLCCDALRVMDKFWSIETAAIDASQQSSPEESFRLRFLLHFKLIGKNKLRVAAGLPVDRFTECLTSPESRSESWLPFGFQILLDIQKCLAGSFGHIKLDVFDHAVHTFETMQEHMTYEDEMWDKGEIPDYMTAGRFKWGTNYLVALQRLIDWLKQLLEQKPEPISGMTNAYFLALHPILSGRTMWDYHRTYHSGAICHVQWFTVVLAHLYNACRQVGGLRTSWPDLDLIIQCQGASRIYVGSPPTDASLFHKRLPLGLYDSSVKFAKDYRGNHHTNLAAKHKRGLAQLPPLEAKIAKYFVTKSRSERSSQLHNVFAFLKSELDKITVEFSDSAYSVKVPKTSKATAQVRIIFATIATKRALKPKNKKSRKRNKSKMPDFSKLDSFHSEVLGCAVSQLADNELYGNFDHLAFFRRAYTIVARIRKELLWDDSKALITMDAAQEPANDFQLLYDLLLMLKPPRDKTQKRQTALYEDGIGKIKKISQIMEEYIKEQGDAEKKNAEEQVRRRRQHDTLLSAGLTRSVLVGPNSRASKGSGMTFNTKPDINFGKTVTSFGNQEPTQEGRTLDEQVEFFSNLLSNALPTSISDREDSTSAPEAHVNTLSNTLQSESMHAPSESLFQAYVRERSTITLSHLDVSSHQNVSHDQSNFADFEVNYCLPPGIAASEPVSGSNTGKEKVRFQVKVLSVVQEGPPVAMSNQVEVIKSATGRKRSLDVLAEFIAHDPCWDNSNALVLQNEFQDYLVELVQRYCSGSEDSRDEDREESKKEVEKEGIGLSVLASLAQKAIVAENARQNDALNVGIHTGRALSPFPHSLAAKAPPSSNPEAHLDISDCPSWTATSNVGSRAHFLRERLWQQFEAKSARTGRPTPIIQPYIQAPPSMTSVSNDPAPMGRAQALRAKLQQQLEAKRALRERPIVQPDKQAVSDTTGTTDHSDPVFASPVYHRFAYSSTRSKRLKRPKTAVITGQRLRGLAKGPRRRLTGARKHNICHNCYGRCLLGRAVLGDKYEEFRNRRKGKGGEDEWEDC
ncbi:hypothetical protein BU23DRAFT_600344 [Bimuria novae-zelandiae CBS 107.79]|uniref:DUF6604 domain-containing protein n=1 Tax=Bimuria novae-zelandiae CBS 107.79 TaxID=1447943 RepID=A0A6A5V3Q6_9PLEO|nr:hypothetical protein BU23DRAFT_600344 [Bimuria novae-zelandiae CBS 107.79]